MSAIAEYLENIPPTTATEPHLYPINVATYHRLGEIGIWAKGERTELIDGKIAKPIPVLKMSCSLSKWRTRA